MSETTAIQWTDHTFNIAWGCVKASAGCDNCYAEKLAHRYGYGWGVGADRRVMSEAYWKAPRKWSGRCASDALPHERSAASQWSGDVRAAA